MDAAGFTASRTAGQPSIATGILKTTWNFAARFAFEWLGFDAAASHRDADHPPATGYRPLP